MGHFTRQSHFRPTRKGDNHVSVQILNNTGPRIVIFFKDCIMIYRQNTIQYSHERNKRHKMHTSREINNMGWQPFYFAEWFNIKLDEGFSYVPFSYNISILNIYIYTLYILKHKII